MKTCTRPHCAIRSHNHDFTFADFLMLDEKYRAIAQSFKDVDNTSTNIKNIKNYKILSGNLELYNRSFCYDTLVELLNYFDSTKNLDLKKLAALYVFAICKTAHIIKFINTEKPKLKNEIINAYNRVLREAEIGGDIVFVREMKRLVPL